MNPSATTVAHLGDDPFTRRDWIVAGVVVAVFVAAHIQKPFNEITLDAGWIGREVIVSLFVGAPAGFKSVRYWLSDYLFQIWVRTFASQPISPNSPFPVVLHYFYVMSLLPKIAGAASLAVLYLTCRAHRLNRYVSLAAIVLLGASTHHWVMSSAVERQIVVQFFLLSALAVTLPSMAAEPLRHAQALAALSLIYLCPIVYSPAIIFTPFLLLLAFKNIYLERDSASMGVSKLVLFLVGFAVVNAIGKMLIGAHVLDILKGASYNLKHYGALESKDPFSAITPELILANVQGLFATMGVWLNYIRSGTNMAPYYGALAVSAAFVVLAYVSLGLAISNTSMALVKSVRATGVGPGFRAWATGPHASIFLLAAAVIVGVLFTLVVRHGNQMEMYVLPYTFLPLVVAWTAERYAGRGVLGSQTICAVLAAILVMWNAFTFPFWNAGFTARNRHIVTIQSQFTDHVYGR